MKDSTDPKPCTHCISTTTYVYLDRPPSTIPPLHCSDRSRLGFIMTHWGFCPVGVDATCFEGSIRVREGKVVVVVDDDDDDDDDE